jgi:hypothetical protein
LFKNGAKINNEKLDVYSLPGFEDKQGKKGPQACYSIISGDKRLSPKNSNNEEIEALTNNNLNGERIKVVLISQAGTEGIDLKNLRQVHILEPWYNLNRIEQIIGRARRNCSHSQLDLKDRNFQLFMHVSKLKNNNIEPLDLFLYRNAEKKSIKIGKVTRILKTVSVDCLLNIGQQKFADAEEEVSIVTSEGFKMKYSIEDKPFSSLCDYMENCSYSCINDLNKDDEINTTTYRYKFTKNNKLIDKIKNLFLSRHVYTKKEIIHLLKINNISTIEIERALYDTIEEKIIITDKFHKLGTIINIGNLYIFQPIESNDKRLLMYNRENPISQRVTEVSLDLPKRIIQNEENIEEIENALNLLNENNEHEAIQNNGNNNKIKPPKILIEIEKKYLLCINGSDTTESESYDTWYQLFEIAKSELTKKGFNIDEELLNKYALHHIIQELKLKDELPLAKYIFKKSLSELTDFEQQIYNYYESLLLENKVKNIEGIYLIDNVNKIDTTEVLYIKNQLTNNLEVATYTDYLELFNVTSKEQINLQKIYISKLKLNDRIGFIGLYNDEFVFKEKDMSVKRFSKGAAVDIKTKNAILMFINEITETSDLFTKENTARIDKSVYSIVAELLLRWFDDTNHKSKRYFLNKFEMSLITTNQKTTKT